jgi:UrcA family protein
MLKNVTATSLLAATVLLTGIATQASAAPDPEVKSARVSYAGLNLSNESDARILLQRIRRAAAQVCSGGSESVLQSTSRNYRSCVRYATGNAVSDLHSPMVTALYTGKTGTEVAKN